MSEEQTTKSSGKQCVLIIHFQCKATNKFLCEHLLKITSNHKMNKKINLKRMLEKTVGKGLELIVSLIVKKLVTR
jgi:hypothetical protein